MKHWHVYLVIGAVIIIFIPIFFLVADYIVIPSQHISDLSSFKKLCRSTGGTFYDDCQVRFAEFCGDGRVIDGLQVACACPVGMLWGSAGCDNDSAMPLDKKSDCVIRCIASTSVAPGGDTTAFCKAQCGDDSIPLQLPVSSKDRTCFTARVCKVIDFICGEGMEFYTGDGTEGCACGCATPEFLRQMKGVL